MRKLVIMERMTIQLRKRMEKHNCATLHDVLRKYGVDILLDTVKATDFCRMLERFGVIVSSKNSDSRYLFEEYGHDGDDDG